MTQLSIEEAEHEFVRLLDRIEPRKVATFLDWIADSFVVVNGENHGKKSERTEVCSDLPVWRSCEVAQADALLRRIALEMRNELPVTAVLDSETKYWPTSGLDSDCNPQTTVHVDSFLYEEDDVDDLVDEGLLSRNYCTKCGSKEVKPLTFISHSLGVDQASSCFLVSTCQRNVT
ncbi:unnamed protein product [Toxocara canis]|uniref:USP domain-containing protein n=1 Tax=Toxocara canis TaxID=6265 RepID=A0A183V5X4_TOXCA|nr:unnamed protein product [Toxocara canis]